MNLIVGNIYSIDETEDPVPLYKTVNLANIFSAYGKFLVLPIEEKLHIFYRSVVKCGENFSDLDCDTLKFQIEFFMCYLENFFNLLKDTSKETL